MKLNSSPEETQRKAANIRLLLLDVDGVLTDGRLYFSEKGEETKAFHTLDGHGIRMLQKAGVEVGIVTGRNSVAVEKRASDLGIRILITGRQDKLNVLQEIKASEKLSDDQISFAGDDLPDLPVLMAVGLSFTVPHAHADLHSRVDCVTEQQGGFGAVREITDFLLRALNAYPEH